MIRIKMILMNLYLFTITITLFALLSTSLTYGVEDINHNNNNSIQQNSNTTTVATNNKILDYKFQPFLLLNGKDFEDISHNNTLLLENFAISAWFKTNQTNLVEPAHIVNKGGFDSDEKGENMNYGIWLSTDGTISGGFETESGEDFEVKSLSKYNDDKWHYVLLSYDGSLLRLYVDGKKQIPTNNKNTYSAIPDTTGDQPLRIGANSLDESKFFTGYIDEVRVWNRGLTDEEIAQIFMNNVFDSKGLVVYLNFDGDGISTRNNISLSSSSSSSSPDINNTKSIGNLTSTMTTNKGNFPNKSNETTSSSISSPLPPIPKTNATATPPLPLAQKDDNAEEDKLVVKTRIQINNLELENTKFIRVIGFINGQEAKEDIPISSIDKTKKTLTVDLKVDKDNGIVEADTPDEFFVCAYKVSEELHDYNSFTERFDCNESDLVNIDKPTVINLFRAGSQVYSSSQVVYNQSSLNNMNNNIQSDTIKIKILAPLADKKDTEKLVIAAMIKGQIKSEVIEDVQSELDKTDSNIISRTFTFDRNTDIGKIQIGDRYHACVSSEDLRPPEGTECEKRLIKHLDKTNSLLAR